MKRVSLPAVFVLFLASFAHAAGFVYNANFVVLTEAGLSHQASQTYAESVLAKAEQYRREIAREWLGQELPPGVGRTTINVRFSDFDDAGLTWAIDHPDRKLHTIYLRTTPDQALNNTLAHEMVHVVLATEFPHPKRLPAWLEEGIASRYDGPQRRQTRDGILQWFRRTGNWPRLDVVLNADNIPAEDTQSYAAAASLTEMLLSRGDKRKLLEFGQATVRSGWQQALRQHYQMTDANQLQALWQEWVGRSGQPLVENLLTQRTSREMLQGQ